MALLDTQADILVVIFAMAGRTLQGAATCKHLHNSLLRHETDTARPIYLRLLRPPSADSEAAHLAMFLGNIKRSVVVLTENNADVLRVLRGLQLQHIIEFSVREVVDIGAAALEPLLVKVINAVVLPHGNVINSIASVLVDQDHSPSVRRLVPMLSKRLLLANRGSPWPGHSPR